MKHEIPSFYAVRCSANAARMSMHGQGDHKVSLDQVIRTIYETGRDKQARYNETSLAGLAVNVVGVLDAGFQHWGTSF
jgi:L-serine deaminase